jgi:hypothetical protein
MEKFMVETRDLKMHPNLLLKVIQDQAGNLTKAILEGCMNAIEAGSKFVHIEYKPEDGKHILTIKDNGRGIAEDEIEPFFETFGTPHSEGEGKIWAKFRMGRGQLFAYGRNRWRTGNLEMSVDIKNDGLKYGLRKGMATIDGCHIEIELYDDPLCYYQSIERLQSSIREQIEFMEVDITFNGVKLNRAASKLKWDEQDENAYYLFSVGQELVIYNLGAYVCKIPASMAGVTGAVVSRKQLAVNFARNEVKSDCPVYQQINEVVKRNRVKRTRKSGQRLTSYERAAALKDLRDGVQSFDDIKNIGLIPTASGKMLTLQNIRTNSLPWSFAAAGDSIADRLIESQQGLILDEAILEDLNYRGEESNLFLWLAKCGNFLGNKWSANYSKWENTVHLHKPFQDMRKDFSDESVLIPQDQWTAREKRYLKCLNALDCWCNRTIVLGKSDSCDGWTDGSTYIAINRNFLNAGYHRVFALLTHEISHDCNTANTHIHGEDFYKHFHDICNSRMANNPWYWLPSFARRLETALRSERHQKAVAKEEKAKQRRNKKLGIAV